MENIEEILADETLTEESLQELKAWLFRENIRLVTAETELKEKQEKFAQEKKQFQAEMKTINRKMSAEQRRIREGNKLVSEKLEIIKEGFRKLDMDRRRLEKDQARVTAEKALIEKSGLYENFSEVSIFFHGVKSPLTLKKRYKDLSKIFHPDNLSGDTEMIQRINREYESLKREYEKFRQA